MNLGRIEHVMEEGTPRTDSAEGLEGRPKFWELTQIGKLVDPTPEKAVYDWWGFTIQNSSNREMASQILASFQSPLDSPVVLSEVTNNMELVSASSTSVFKLCAFPTGAGGGRGGSEEPGSVVPNTPVPTILAKWKPSPGSLTERQLGEVEAVVSLPGGHSLISAHSFDDSGPGSILFYHKIDLEMVIPEAPAATSKTAASSSNGADSSAKSKKKGGDEKPKPQPRITPSCFPLGVLSTQDTHTVSLHMIPESNQLIQILKNGKGRIVDISDLAELREAPKPKSGKSKKSEASVHHAILAEFDLEQEVVYTRLNPFNPDLIAVIGPHGVTACVFDLSKQELAWRARNVKPDTLRMEVPVSDMNCDWMTATKLVVCTAHSHVRVYELEEGARRPVMTFSLADEFAKSSGPSKFQQLTKGDVAFSLRHIACNPSKRTDVAVACNTGDLFILTLEREAHKGHIRSRQKGVQGAIRALEYHPTRPNALVAAGLDRFVRAWDANKSKSLGTLYTKLRQNVFVWTDVLAPILKTHKEKVHEENKKRKLKELQEQDEDSFHESDFSDFEGDESESGEDNLWQEMKVAGEKKRKRDSGNGKKMVVDDEEDDEPAIKKKPKKKAH